MTTEIPMGAPAQRPTVPSAPPDPNPFVESIMERIAKLSPAKRAILFSKLEFSKLEASPQEHPRAIVPRDRAQPTPLSFSQQRLWFLNQLEGPSATYTIAFHLRLTGSLNVGALEQCLGDLVARHESLRTCFVKDKHRPIQHIFPKEAPEGKISLGVVDLSDREREAQSRAVEEYTRTAAQHIFDLQVAPLLWTQLLRLDERTHILLVALHHIIVDGWSMGIFAREIMAFYPARCRGESPHLAPLALQYGDYALWQRQQLSGDGYRQRLKAWANTFRDAPPLLELPTDHLRPAVQSFRGDLVRVEIASSPTFLFKSFCQERQKTLFMGLLAVFLTLLYRYSRQQDLIVGTPMAGRLDGELDDLIGFFVNTLPLRFALGDDLSFSDLLDHVQTTTLQAFAHQDIPFEQLIEQLPLARDLSHLPLCQVMFTLQNAPTHEFQLPDLDLVLDSHHNGVARFDLTLSVTEVGDRLVGAWEYNTDLFERSTIERMAAQFEQLLQAVLTNPQHSLATLPLLPSQDYERLVAGSQTSVDRPVRCIHHWFEAQVEKTPEAIALTDGSRHLTYGELNQRANQLAHYLQSLGIQPDDRVGICLESGLDRLVVMLGVLKAGGAYVPLDPHYPVERLAHMVKDAQMERVILSSDLVDRLPDLAPTVGLFWDILIQPLAEMSTQTLTQDWAKGADRGLDPFPTTNPASAVTPNHLAYVIYTSGSTGLPKGVMVEHRGLGNLALAQIDGFQVTSQSRILQMASFSFDASVSEIWMAWCAGACLCVGGFDTVVTQAGRLAALGITHLTLPPSVLNVLPVDHLATVDHLIVAGEACSADGVARWSRRAGFYNAYGPTEATVCATIANCTETDGSPPLGHPLANVQIYVVDSQLQPVPVGVPGELLIGGIGLARGYLNQPELTAKAFVPHPFSQQAGDRLYRTGDLVRYRTDGQLQYLGRLDHQVKLRGFRIELGEIEAALRAYGPIQEAIALVQNTPSAHTSNPGIPVLTAYVVLRSGSDSVCSAEFSQETEFSQEAEFSQETLVAHLRDRLPQYMVPGAFVVLDRLPLTPNGKVDRHALPKPEIQKNLRASAPPRTPMERLIADLWRDVLSVDTVGRHDNFFDLGGQSLLMVHIQLRLQERLDREIAIVDLFQFPTIADLAQHLEPSNSKSSQPKSASFQSSSSQSSSSKPSSFPTPQSPPVALPSNLKERRALRRTLRRTVGTSGNKL